MCNETRPTLSPDGTVWDNPQIAPPDWVWEPGFTGPSQETFDFATQLAAQQTVPALFKVHRTSLILPLGRVI